MTKVCFNHFMSLIIAKLLVGALSITIVAEALEAITISGPYIALIVALLLGFVNIFVKPILIIVTLPINILTFGLFTFVINGLLFLFLASFIDGFTVDGILWAIIASIFVTALNWVGNQFVSFLAKNN